MRRSKNVNEVKAIIANNTIALLYVSSEKCGVCNVIFPRLTHMLKSYPAVMAVQINIDEAPLITGEYNIFTIPCVLVFIEGKEVIREARYINIKEIEEKIARYYSMIEIEGM